MDALTYAIASLYADLIEKELWQLKQVPRVYRTATKKELDNRAAAREAKEKELHA